MLESEKEIKESTIFYYFWTIRNMRTMLITMGDYCNGHKEDKEDKEDKSDI